MRHKFKSECSNSNGESEFGSEDEEVEYGLYAQLYFEPNPDATKGHTTSKVPQPNECKTDVDNDFQKKETARLNSPITGECEAPKLTKEKNDVLQHNEAHMPGHSSQPHLSQLSTLVGTAAEIDFINSLKADPKAPKCSTMVDCPTNEQTQEACIQQDNISEKVPASLNLHESHSKTPIPSRTARERFSSICSEGSIPGSIALDGLYCTITIPDEAEEDVSNKVAIMDREKQKEMFKDDPRKKARKRKMSDGSDSSVCEWEESRCNSLTSRELKSVKPTTLKRNYNLACGNDSESDIYLLTPPSPKQHETYMVSSSDNEFDKSTDLRELALPSPKQHETYIVSSSSDNELDTSTDLRELIRSKMKEKSSTLPHEHTCNNKYKRAKTLEKPKSKVFDSSDSDSTLPDLTQGTDLILNIDSDLSNLIPKSKQDKYDISNKIRLPTNSCVPEYNSPLDYTKGRCDAIKPPSCDHWTQEMVNFYDLDVSEDLEIEEVHKQQTNDRSAWHIIAADYQVKQSRRYYSRPDRCIQCREFGHRKENCPRVLHCHLCSETDHITRFKCPDNCCFRCGGRLHYFCPETSASVTCSLCGYHGHRIELCPDLWRRFHLTTSGTAVHTPENFKTRPSKDRYCFNCGRRGHFGHDCPMKFQNCSYVQVPQSVTSYSTPVTLMNGSAVINREGAQVVNDDALKISIKRQEIGRVLGRKGATIQEIQRRSETTVHVITNEDGAEVRMYGSKKACSAAQDMIEVLLKRKTVKELEDFVMHVSQINDQVLHPNETKVADSRPMSTNDYSRTLNVAWYNKYLHKLGTNKISIITKLKKNIKQLNLAQANLDLPIHQLIQFKRSLDRKCVTHKMVRNIRIPLKRVALVVIGRAKFGPGGIIHEKLQQMLKDVQASSSNEIAEELCGNIVDILKPVFAPPLESLDELLEYAHQYQQLHQVRSNGKQKNILQNEMLKVKRGKTERGNVHEGNEVRGTIDQNEDGIMHTKIKTNKGKRKAKKKRLKGCAPNNYLPGNQNQVQVDGNINRITEQNAGEGAKNKTIAKQNRALKNINKVAKLVEEENKTTKQNKGAKKKKKKNLKQNGNETMMNIATKQNGGKRKINKKRLRAAEEMTGNAPMINQSKGNAVGAQKKKWKKCWCQKRGQQLCGQCVRKPKFSHGKPNRNAIFENY